ncbi:MAG: energy transducer TonB [Gallionellales bacterium RIFCSPLOWO2_12_FULL_59_22]|nr:MAG: energy transducer TonB [Gallionellales bacterium RIFCSPLOWO2_02_FULL_59_110]OGT05712.1 MAG: energy transducer TonB [Gallionellales bacterium RIFCSPLOWO2_02_58_13]OGT13955.1 MAG: energy transducer TonB [Gallionellales bacterium RIFCSPLOWO2_12_FULL_59_22]
MAFSVALHAFALFGIGLVLSGPRSAANFNQPLEVVLVNAKSKSRPAKADALAQANLDGGGNTAEERRAKTPLPAIRDDKQLAPEQATRRVAQLEEESRRVLTRLKSEHKVAQPEPRKLQSGDTSRGEDLVQKALEIARLEAQIDKNWDAYQKMPRRTFIGARTKEYRFAQYIEDWRIKVERIGNLNYPEQARQQKIFGKLQLSVSIRADGSVENIEVSRSSGHRILDAAAMRIVKLAAPYAPLSQDIRKDTDILTITRTWTFTSSDRMESE